MIQESKAEAMEWEEGHFITQQVSRMMRQYGITPGVNNSGGRKRIQPLKPQHHTSEKVVLTLQNEKKHDMIPNKNNDPINEPSFFTVDLSNSHYVESLEGHTIGFLGCEKLASDLLNGACARVLIINLGWNMIFNRGFCALIHVLGGDKAIGKFIIHLDIRNNQISSHGLQSMKEAIITRGALPSLKHFDARQNPIGNDGARILIHIIVSGKLQNIETIIVKGCGIRDCGVQALLSVLNSYNLMIFVPNLIMVNARDNEASANLLRTSYPWPHKLQL